ncbi:hypothetical protein G1H11_16070 [Phytoactinopolyspora alkaliphila]|uniref:Uncharacterized protein n=1 Tax=Phytoactinopolyspora alkaliphila TaxID=1783498 RepID=A0A6N9YPF9_9ACTN|nr:hypothetical protein [Phytoactinopolyspora alkaliphila]NED96825.1 hypothetical protein [Phytoactinopolyspora alkaliphila]
MTDSISGRQLPNRRKTSRWWLAEHAADGDHEAAAAAIILCDPIFAGDWRLWAHVDDNREEIDWDGILADRTWSSGEHLLLELGRNLWSGGHQTAVDLTKLVRLGDRFFSVALSAIEARRGCGPLPRTEGQRASASPR